MLGLAILWMFVVFSLGIIAIVGWVIYRIVRESWQLFIRGLGRGQTTGTQAQIRPARAERQSSARGN